MLADSAVLTSDSVHFAEETSISLEPAAVSDADTEWSQMLETVSEEAANENQTAQDLLNAVLTSHDWRAVKSKEDIQKMFADVSHRRSDYVEKLASKKK